MSKGLKVFTFIPYLSITVLSDNEPRHFIRTILLGGLPVIWSVMWLFDDDDISVSEDISFEPSDTVGVCVTCDTWTGVIIEWWYVVESIGEVERPMDSVEITIIR